MVAVWQDVLWTMNICVGKSYSFFLPIGNLTRLKAPNFKILVGKCSQDSCLVPYHKHIIELLKKLMPSALGGPGVLESRTSLTNDQILLVSVSYLISGNLQGPVRNRWHC